MNSRKEPILFLAIVLFITWLLTNSITPVLLRPSGAKTSKTVNIGIGPIPSIGIGIGHGLFGRGIGIKGLGIGSLGRFFVVNMSMLYTETPIIVLELPKVHGLALKYPHGLTLRYPSILIQFLETPIVIIPRLYPQPIKVPGLPKISSGGGGGGGGGGGRGLGGLGGIGTGTTNTGTEVVRVLYMSIPWLIYLVIAIVAVLMVFAVVSMRRPHTRMETVREERLIKRRVETPKIETRIELPKPSESRPPVRIPSISIPINPSVVPLRGWGGSKYVDLPVSSDLPLTWVVNEPMRYEIKKPGVRIEVEPEGLITNEALIFQREGCHEIMIKVGDDVVERHVVLVVHSYDEHVMESFRANMVRHKVVNFEKKTPREICRELVSKGALIDVKCGGWASLRVFEKARYGHYRINRAEYESFLRGLSKVRDGVIVGCKG